MKLNWNWFQWVQFKRVRQHQKLSKRGPVPSVSGTCSQWTQRERKCEYIYKIKSQCFSMVSMIKYLARMNRGGINILERQTAALTASQRKHNAHFSPAARWCVRLKIRCWNSQFPNSQSEILTDTWLEQFQRPWLNNPRWRQCLNINKTKKKLPSAATAGSAACLNWQ